MRCSNCGEVFDERSGDCPSCGAVPEINTQILDDREKDGYIGVTIDQDGNEEQKENYRQNSQYYNNNVYVKRVNLPVGIISQIIGLIVLAIVAFVLLPTVLIGILVVAVIWSVYKLLFR